MSYLSIIILALALSVDACIVSFSYGLVLDKSRIKSMLQLAVFTGLFQGLMSLFGYYSANLIKAQVISYSKFIVFLIFIFLGIKFISEAFETKKKKELCLGLKCLILIGIATSIDAFGAGISLLLMGNRILKPAILIALITFIDSIFGFYIGGKLKYFQTKTLEIIAGLLLIFLGICCIY